MYSSMNEGSNEENLLDISMIIIHINMDLSLIEVRSLCA